MTHFFKVTALRGAIAAAALAGTTAAQAQPAAETFTFQTEASNQVGVGNDGTRSVPYFAGYVVGTSQTTFADGTKRAGNYTCVSMSQTPTDKLFDVHMLCDVTDSQGSYSAALGCTVIDAATTNWSCIGGLYGNTGAYEGRRGSVTNHSVAGAATGTGQWYR